MKDTQTFDEFCTFAVKEVVLFAKIAVACLLDGLTHTSGSEAMTTKDNKHMMNMNTSGRFTRITTLSSSLQTTQHSNETYWTVH